MKTLTFGAYATLCAAALATPATATDILWSGRDDFHSEYITFEAISADRLEFIDDSGVNAAYFEGINSDGSWTMYVSLRIDGVWRQTLTRANYTPGKTKIEIAGIAPISFARGSVTGPAFLMLAMPNSTISTRISL